MDYPALILNADRQPISIYPLKAASMERAFSRVTSGKAVPLAFYDAEIRSKRSIWVPPSVIIMKELRSGPQTVAFSRMNILVRDEFSCQYCGCGLSMAEMTFDHVKPRSQGGNTSFENIVAACFDCNKKKADKSIMQPMRMPRRPTAEEMSMLRPVRRSEIPDDWALWLRGTGVSVIDDGVRDPNSVMQKVRDRIYWNSPLEQ